MRPGFFLIDYLLQNQSDAVNISTQSVFAGQLGLQDAFQHKKLFLTSTQNNK